MAHCDKSLRPLALGATCFHEPKQLPIITEGALLTLCVHKQEETVMRPRAGSKEFGHKIETCVSFVMPKNLCFQGGVFVAATIEAKKDFLALLNNSGITEDDIKNYRCTIERILP